MKFTQLKYFVAVCQYGSFANAAKALFVSQPAVGQSVRELENEYKTRLFDRLNNRVVLTKEGEWLLEKSKSLLQHMETIASDFKIISQGKTTVKIGVAPILGNTYIYRTMNKLRTDHPEIFIDIREAGSLEIEKWLGNATIDFGICVLDCMNEEKFKMEKILDSELKFFIHKSHPLAQRTSVKIEDLKDISICILREDSYQNLLIRQKFSEAGISPDVIMYSSQISSIATMLSCGNCGTFMFEKMFAGSSDIVAIPLEPKIVLSIGAVWAKEQQYASAETARKYIVRSITAKK